MISIERRITLVALSVLAVLTIVGCGAGSPEEQAGNGSGESTAYAKQTLSREHLAASTIRIYDTYAEAMPNRTFRHATGTAQVSDSVIRGHSVGVEKGRGWFADANGENVTEVAFDDDRSEWKSLHLRIAVDEHLGGERHGKEVLAGLTFTGVDADFARLSESLESLGEVVVPLREGSPHFTYDPRVIAVAEGGELLAQIGPAGELSLPFGEKSVADALLQSTPNLSALEREVAKPALETQRNVGGID